MFHHIWSLRVCIAQMGSDLMVSQLSLGNVAYFWCGMQRVQILLHHLTLPLLHNKLEQLFNSLKKRRFKNIITHASFYSSGNWVFGPRTTQFHKELGQRLRQVSGEANKYAYFTQSLSVAIQRGNAAFVLGTMKVDSEDEEFFFVRVLSYHLVYLV